MDEDSLVGVCISYFECGVSYVSYILISTPEKTNEAQQYTR